MLVLLMVGFLAEESYSRSGIKGFLVVFPLNVAQIGPKQYEYYNTGNDNQAWVQGVAWRAQTFTVGSTGHTVTHVKIEAYKTGNPGTLTLGIQNTDGNGHPTGNDLTSGTINANTFVRYPGAWYEITVTEYTLSVGTKYAIVCRATAGGGSNYVSWRYDSTSPTYADGNWEASGDSGHTWTSSAAKDFMFEVWGNALGETVSETSTTSRISSTSTVTMTTTETLTSTVTMTTTETLTSTVTMTTTETLTSTVTSTVLPAATITVDSRKTIAVNNLSLGFMLDHEWKGYIENSFNRELAGNARFNIVRVFDSKKSSPRPCTYWNESAKTGTFNWTDVDLLVQRIFEIGAEPLFCLGSYSEDGFPSGMAMNPATSSPYPESFAAYASEWVKHFRALGLPVRFYEIVNEPWVYFGWEPVDFTKLKNYMEIFNSAAASMRRENSNLLISHDFIIRKPVLDYWLANGGADVDCLNFHKYGDWLAGRLSDSEMLRNAEEAYYGTGPMGYSIDEARQAWLKARGKLLPVLNSESNFNSAYKNGTDPRIQQMVGAVWTALVLRMDALNGLRYHIYYSFSSSASYGKTTPTEGAGFGMINSDDNRPWYPYYVQYMLGNSLGVGDSFLDTTSSSEDIRTLAWIHNGMLNIFLICKVNQPRIVYLQGVTGEAKLFKIDDTIPWTTPTMQSGTINVANPLVVNGYAVVLLQMNRPTEAQPSTTPHSISYLFQCENFMLMDLSWFDMAKAQTRFTAGN